MAQAAQALRMDQLAGIGAGERALAKFETLSEDVDAALARRKSNGLVRRGIKAWKRGNVSRAGQLCLQATDIDETNAQAFHILAMVLDKLGHRHKALVTYERAFQLDPEDPDLLINLGLMAWQMRMTDAAEKMFRLHIAACPDSPLGYNNLGTIQSEKGQRSAGIETIRSAIYRMPTEPVLWNALATVLADDGRSEESLTFYEEAVRLDPTFSRPWHNLGFAYSHLGRLEEALAAYDKSLEYMLEERERTETIHSRSVCLMGMGRLEEGFREYEVRNIQRFRAYVHHVIEAPVWSGEPLDGKRVLIVGEQGLGDELMFANILPDLARAVGPDGKLQIAVDPRLIPMFQRSFPQADVGTYDDRTLMDRDGNKELRFVPFAQKPDFYAPMGTPLQYLRKNLEDFPREAFLKADPARVAGFRAQLEAIGPGPYVGVCWRSMTLGAKRKKYYSALDMWNPILQTPGVTFVNVQYGDCTDELQRAQEQSGVRIHTIDGLDLKNDLDGAAALSEALDLVISAPTAAAATAGSVGTEVWFLMAGRTWPQLGTDHYPWYRASRVFAPEKFADWAGLMPQVSSALAAFAATE
ncbi:MAG TPA: tetratricopeptide repeat protein [Rhizomicrobium sp.]|nr:tetratricopeptide repeat protein [Rhizomicrobium sp.]